MFSDGLVLTLLSQIELKYFNIAPDQFKLRSKSMFCAKVTTELRPRPIHEIFLISKFLIVLRTMQIHNHCTSQ